jgi:aspartate aminotransferase
MLATSLACRTFGVTARYASTWSAVPAGPPDPILGTPLFLRGSLMPDKVLQRRD